MSGRLDQPLDSIIESQKKAKREARRRKVGKPSGATAPVGGVKKSTKPVKAAIKPVAGVASSNKSSKIVVSGLPFDVNEAQIKEFFSKSVGKVKKVSLQYNQNGQSRGIADIQFLSPDFAAKAAKDLNGMLIELVVDASSVPPAPAKSLADRVAANPKAQPKSATAVKKDTKDGAKGRAGKPARKRAARSARPKPKTAEELDAEMTDYWGGNNPSAVAAPADTTGNNGNAAPAAANADDAMDEISVSDIEFIC
ncbi:hypothetical protein PV08_09131 [Exophiala spinifera]|uniref:RRM domain-containing protein n=1 Tax=Exophiala spinifera TaxID=91928 RepID=A0A0D2AYR1_9EURO|nr:uncharacterized protein PV08_09131 [Exophiala spinifera]KIW11858.1 hypothetical protein PV08_09131 [Exophiala spinifera]